jgi:hypothetical protein
MFTRSCCTTLRLRHVAVFLLLAVLRHATAQMLGIDPFLRPQFREVVNASTTYQIIWTAQAFDSSVDITLWDRGGPNISGFGIAPCVQAYCTILALNAPNTGTFSWNVPGNIPSYDGYELELQFGANTTEYFRTFSIHSDDHNGIYDRIRAKSSLPSFDRSYCWCCGCIASDHRLCSLLL